VYWEALARIFEVAFANPTEYSIQRSTGVYAFHRIFSGDYPPDLLQGTTPVGVYAHCERNNNFSTDFMENVLRQMCEAANRSGEFGRGVNDEFWHKGRRGVPPLGYELARATSQKGIGELSAKLGKHLAMLP